MADDGSFQDIFGDFETSEVDPGKTTNVEDGADDWGDFETPESVSTGNVEGVDVNNIEDAWGDFSASLDAAEEVKTSPDDTGNGQESANVTTNNSQGVTEEAVNDDLGDFEEPPQAENEPSPAPGTAVVETGEANTVVVDNMVSENNGSDDVTEEKTDADAVESVGPQAVRRTKGAEEAAVEDGGAVPGAIGEELFGTVKKSSESKDAREESENIDSALGDFEDASVAAETIAANDIFEAGATEDYTVKPKDARASDREPEVPVQQPERPTETIEEEQTKKEEGNTENDLGGFNSEETPALPPAESPTEEEKDTSVDVEEDGAAEDNDWGEFNDSAIGKGKKSSEEAEMSKDPPAADTAADVAVPEAEEKVVDDAENDWGDFNSEENPALPPAESPTEEEKDTSVDVEEDGAAEDNDWGEFNDSPIGKGKKSSEEAEMSKDPPAADTAADVAVPEAEEKVADNAENDWGDFNSEETPAAPTGEEDSATSAAGDGAWGDFSTEEVPAPAPVETGAGGNENGGDAWGDFNTTSMEDASPNEAEDADWGNFESTEGGNKEPNGGAGEVSGGEEEFEFGDDDFQNSNESLEVEEGGDGEDDDWGNFAESESFSPVEVSPKIQTILTLEESKFHELTTSVFGKGFDKISSESGSKDTEVSEAMSSQFLIDLLRAGQGRSSSGLLFWGPSKCLSCGCLLRFMSKNCIVCGKSTGMLDWKGRGKVGSIVENRLRSALRLPKGSKLQQDEEDASKLSKFSPSLTPRKSVESSPSGNGPMPSLNINDNDDEEGASLFNLSETSVVNSNVNSAQSDLFSAFQSAPSPVRGGSGRGPSNDVFSTFIGMEPANPTANNDSNVDLLSQTLADFGISAPTNSAENKAMDAGKGILATEGNSPVPNAIEKGGEMGKASMAPQESALDSVLKVLSSHAESNKKSRRTNGDRNELPPEVQKLIDELVVPNYMLSNVLALPMQATEEKNDVFDGIDVPASPPVPEVAPTEPLAVLTTASASDTKFTEGSANGLIDNKVEQPSLQSLGAQVLAEPAEKSLLPSFGEPVADEAESVGMANPEDTATITVVKEHFPSASLDAGNGRTEPVVSAEEVPGDDWGDFNDSPAGEEEQGSGEPVATAESPAADLTEFGAGEKAGGAARVDVENSCGDFSTGEEPVFEPTESPKEEDTATNEADDDWGDFQ